MTSSGICLRVGADSIGTKRESTEEGMINYEEQVLADCRLRQDFR